MANGTGETELQFELKRVRESDSIERRAFKIIVG
jgi:hypothetical protein